MRHRIATVIGTAFLIAAPLAANAGNKDIAISIGLPGFSLTWVEPGFRHAPAWVAPAPVYVRPAPVYAPAPVYYPEPVYYRAPAYVPPRPVYVERPAWDGPRGHWRHDHARHRDGHPERHERFDGPSRPVYSR